MALDRDGGARRGAVANAIRAELARQSHADVTRVDVDALALAVEEALGFASPNSEGKHPDELNATNDD